MDKRFLAIIGVIIALFVGIFLWSGNQKTTEDSSTSTSGQPSNHIRGKTDSTVKFVEYSDFQCPYCAQYNPMINQLYEKYKDKVSFQFSYYPLSQIHLNAISSARAAEAAGNQDKFWEMSDMLFENQDTWGQDSNARTIFEGYAEQLGLDVAKFKTDYASSITNDTINADKRKFNETGLAKSTPTFTLNGKQIRAVSVGEFSALIDAALKKAEQ
jgi:protein-disulfide isomerase